jgi:hypothetical protein
MKAIAPVVALATLVLLQGPVQAQSVHVRSYTRSDGTHVRAHTRSAPGSGGRSMGAHASQVRSLQQVFGGYAGPVDPAVEAEQQRIRDEQRAREQTLLSKEIARKLAAEAEAKERYEAERPLREARDAQFKLDAARDLLQDDNPVVRYRGLDRLDDLVRRYPDTRAAAEAKQLLLKLGVK